MIIGYTLSGNASNDGVFFENAPKGVLCPSCKTCLDPDYFPKEIKIHNSKKYDISYTHDLRTLFSQRFADFFQIAFNLSITSRLLKSSTGDLYYYVPTDVIEYDSVERKTRFINQCTRCNNYKEIIGASPVFLKSRSLIQKGIHRTDLEFASGSSKHPLLIIGIEWYEKLKIERFRGLYMEPILDDPWIGINSRLAKTHNTDKSIE